MFFDYIIEKVVCEINQFIFANLQLTVAIIISGLKISPKVDYLLIQALNITDKLYTLP